MLEVMPQEVVGGGGRRRVVRGSGRKARGIRVEVGMAASYTHTNVRGLQKINPSL